MDDLLLDDEQGRAFLAESSEALVELVHDDRGEAERELVGDHDPRLEDQHAGEGEHALLTARQRSGELALGRVLASEPRVLLADELSLGLAPMVVERLLAAVRAAADSGVAVVLVEQHVRQALAIADRVHVLRRGRIVLSGDADDLRGDAESIAAHYLTGDSPQP